MGGNGKISKDELKRLLEEVEAEGFEDSKEKMMLKRLNDAARRGALTDNDWQVHRINGGCRGGRPASDKIQ